MWQWQKKYTKYRFKRLSLGLPNISPFSAYSVTIYSMSLVSITYNFQKVKTWILQTGSKPSFFIKNRNFVKNQNYIFLESWQNKSCTCLTQRSCFSREHRLESCIIFWSHLLSNVCSFLYSPLKFKMSIKSDICNSKCMHLNEFGTQILNNWESSCIVTFPLWGHYFPSSTYSWETSVGRKQQPWESHGALA